MVLKTLNESWPKETLKAVLKGVKQEVEVENSKGYFEVLHAPYVKGFSEGLHRKLRRLQVGLVPKTGETLYSNLCKLKQRTEREECKNVVYSVPCGDCGIRYIGETGQHFLVKGEANIKGTLRIERRLMVSIATFEKIKDTR